MLLLLLLLIQTMMMVMLAFFCDSVGDNTSFCVNTAADKEEAPIILMHVLEFKPIFKT